MQRKRQHVQAVDRALQILEILKDRPRGIGVTELSEILGVSKSTAHRLLTTLESKDFVRKDNNDKYLLGLALIELGKIVLNRLDIKDLFHPYLEELGKETNETTHLAIYDDIHVVYIDKIESEQTLRMFSNIGKRGPMYCTGIGKAILAFLPDEEIERILDRIDFVKYTHNTIVDRDELLKEFKWIRKHGYAIDDEEHELGIKCAAAPIFDLNGQVIAGVSVAGPSIRLADDKFQKVVDLVLEKSKEMSRILGYKKDK